MSLATPIAIRTFYGELGLLRLERLALIAPAACLTVKPVGEPDAEIGISGSMSEDGKRSVAEWPKLPRPPSGVDIARDSCRYSGCANAGRPLGQRCSKYGCAGARRCAT